MSVFACRSRDASGNVVEKTIEAESQREALSLLEQCGLAPIEIKAVLGDISQALPSHAPSAASPPVRSSPSTGSTVQSSPLLAKSKARLKRKELRRFTIQLGGSLRAGVPIYSALGAMLSQSEDRHYTATLTHLIHDIEAGLPLSEAMGSLPRAFPQLYVGTVEAGERSGTLDDMLDDLIEYLEADMEMRADVRSAIMYPAIVMCTLGMAMAVMIFFVVPRFATFYEGFNAELPLPTRILIGASNIVKSYGVWVAAGSLALLFGLSRLLKRPAVQGQVERMARRIPIIGHMLETATTLQIARMLHLVTGAGLPLLEGLETIAKAMRSAKSKEDLRAVAKGIESGATLAEGLEAARCLPPDARQMISTGEQTGSLHRACGVVAEQNKKELRYLTKNAATFIEPLLTLFLAAVVLFVALAAFLPMWDLVRIVR